MFANGWHHHDQHCHDHLLHNPYHQSHLLHHHDLLNQDEEQWWTARNSLGQTGSIPVPYVAKVIQRHHHIIDSHQHHLGLGLTTNWCNFQEWLNFVSFVLDSRNPVAGWSFHLFEANFSAFSDFVDHCGHPPASPPMSLSFNERSPQYLTQFLHEEASPTHTLETLLPELQEGPVAATVDGYFSTTLNPGEFWGESLSCSASFPSISHSKFYPSHPVIS